ncbi:MAG: hypothetical protein D6715_14535, partial [Calditrichaeota bacterium]
MNHTRLASRFVADYLPVFLVVLGWLVCFCLPPARAESPVVGLWVVRHQLTRPAQIDSLVQRAVRWGITD